MLNNIEYKEVIKKIKAKSHEEFMEYIACPYITDTGRQLLYDRFGRNKIAWWNKNKTIAAISLHCFMSEKTVQRETKRILSIIETSDKLSSKKTELRFGLEDWKKAS